MEHTHRPTLIQQWIDIISENKLLYYAVKFQSYMLTKILYLFEKIVNILCLYRLDSIDFCQKS